MIPFLDLGRLHDSIRDELDEAFARVLKNSSFINGSEVTDFEAALAAAHGRAHAVGCASGTDALALALRALGVGAGDEVIVPAMTFVATAEAVVHSGATPVLADVDDETMLLTPATTAAVRTSQTRAVIPVHLYGHVVSSAHMREWSDVGLLVLEDAAQAHLGSNDGALIGTFGAAATLSFFPGKNLGALGDAGAILTDDAALAAEARKLRDHGRTEKYLHDEVGYGSRLDALQAAFLAVKLRHLPAWTERRRELAEHYRASLTGIEDVALVPWSAGAVHHLVCVRVANGGRDQLAAALRERGIATGMHYPVALSQQPSLRQWWQPCPASETAADDLLSLPIDPLMTIAEVDTVAAAIRAVLT